MDQLSEEEIRRTIEVSGMPENADLDDIYGFFENTRFGGGEIVKLELPSMTDGAAFITFSDEGVVDSLLSRQAEKKMRVCGSPIEIRRYEKPEPVPVIGRTIVVSGIPSNLDQDDILGFFENPRKGGGPTENISSGETDGVSIITFAQQSVAEHFVDLGEVTFGGNKLQVAWPMSAGRKGDKVVEEVICPRTIIIHNISEDNVETLELSLESKRSGGGKLESMLRNSDGSFAATFVEEKVAVKFLERGSVKVAGKVYEVTKPSSNVRKGPGKTSAVQEIPNTIEVSGIPETTSEEFLKMYFENKKRSGGGDIKTMTYNKQEGVATITFTEPSAVLKIVEKGEHKIGSDVLQVIALESLTPDLIDQMCAIRVTNIPPTISREFLEVYFESAKRSGGEEFDEFLFDKDGGCATVVYKSPEVCKRVMNRSHQLESVQLAVEALKPAPPPPIVVGETDEKRLLVCDLPPDFNDKDLKAFLENAAGCQIIQFIHGPLPDLVLVDFKGIPNYAALRKLVVSRPFQGQMIFVQKVKPSSCILVHGTKSFSDDMLSLHFENSKRSGGGEVKGIRRDARGDVIVEFHDRKVIPAVLKKKQVVENQPLKTELFHDCLTGSSGSISRRQKVRIPEDVTLSVEKRVLKFISDSVKIKAQVESEMQALHCAIQWQKPEVGEIKLSCTLTPETKDVVKLAAKWETTCSEQLITQLKNIVVKDENVSAEIWEDFVKEAKPTKKSGVSVEMDQASRLMRVVGLDAAVADYLKTAAEIRNRLLEELAKRKSKTFKSIKSLKPNQLQFLKALKFPTGQPTISKDLDVDIDDHQVSFQGTGEEINQAMIIMFEMVNNMHTQLFAQFDQRKAKFIQKRQVIDYFKELFEKNSLKVFWSVKAQVLEVSGMTDTEISKALSLLDSEIQWKDITLDINELPLMKQEKWHSLKKDLENTFKIIEITQDMHVSAVTVVSTKDCIDQIENEIRAFLKQHTILEQFIPMEEGKVAYIEQFFIKEINDIQDRLKGEGVVIEMMQKKNSSGILVRGTKAGLDQAVRRLFEIQQPILCTTHETEIYGVQRYFSTTRGKESKEKIENKNKVIVEIARQPKNSGAAAANGGLQADGSVKGPIEKSTVNLKSSVIKVLKGNVAECQVKAMAILIGGDLKHTDGVAKAVVEVGGKEIEEECQAHAKANGRLLPGQIYVSKPGSLSCTGIIHVAVPPWQNGTKKEVDCLEEGMWKALEKAEEKGWTSLAISPGTNYPAATATKTIVDTVEEFLDERKNLKIQILLIDSTDQVVNHFHEMLIGKFGKNAVKIGEGQQSNALLASPVPVGTTLDQLSLIQTNYQPGKDAATLLTPEGVKVTLIQDSIATQNVDVIVNTASKDLNLNQGAASNSILQAAGANLQAECKSKMPNGLQPGQILVTAGYSLQCKSVYHGVCDQWDGGKGKSEQVIRDLLRKAFSTAHQSQMTSIAIPALGTGNLGTPREIVSALMYAEAEEFSKANPTSTLKNISFVVFDKPTVDVFQEHVNRLRNPSAVSTDKGLKTKQKRQLKPEKAESSFSFATPEKTIRPTKEDVEAAEADISLDIPMKTIKIKSLVMEIKQGDITQENTDAIVNSTNRDLNLYGGAVTKAILQAGGRAIADECKKLGKTDKNGVAVTGAGNLKCKCIIHLATPETLYVGNAPEGKAWEKRIFHCLEEAERIKLTSIAFPLLGTGKWNTSAGEMAINILNAVGRFAVNCKPKHLKIIRITIFQPTMVDEFFTALTKQLSEKKTTKSILGRLTGLLTWFVSTDSSANNDGNDGFEVVEDPQTSALVDYKCVFRVYGLSQSVIDKVIVELENLVKEAVTDKVLEDPDQQEAIAKLTLEQIKQLERDAASHQVRATVEQGRRLNRIRLQGDAKDITDVVVNVVKILKEVEVAELKRNEAERIAQQAHWEFEDDDGSYEKYPSDINAIIERAFQSRVGFALWEENDGQFKIDFKTKTEENLKNKAKVKVQRIGDAPIEEPKNWDPMNLGEGCKLVQVPVGSNEYDEVEQRIKATCQKSCKEIMKIERVQNHSLYQQYAVKKLHMEASAGTGTTVERILWHGTSEETVKQINTHGFNRSYCGKNATAYGRGVYFARDWPYSAHATYSPPNSQGFKFIYQARVLTGEFTLGNHEYIDAPLKPNQTIERYDSVVDNVQNPTIFVVFRDAQVYPEYLITFI